MNRFLSSPTSNRQVAVASSPPPFTISRNHFLILETPFQGLERSNGSDNKKHSRRSADKKVVNHQSPRTTKLKFLGGKSIRQKEALPSMFSPQEYFNAMISLRGYSMQTFPTLKSAYYNTPSPFQEASYGSYLESLVQNQRLDELHLALTCGISPNPATVSGESLLHMVCRTGNVAMLKILIEAGCDMRVANALGRTPLHEACSVGCWDMFALLLEVDSDMIFMTDYLDVAPLSLVPQEHYAQWLTHLDSHQEQFWPQRTNVQPVPELALLLPNSRPVPLPKHPLPISLVKMVATGRIAPSDARRLQYATPISSNSACITEKTDVDISPASSNWEDEMEGILNSWCTHPLRR